MSGPNCPRFLPPPPTFLVLNAFLRNRWSDWDRRFFIHQSRLRIDSVLCEHRTESPRWVKSAVIFHVSPPACPVAATWIMVVKFHKIGKPRCPSFDCTASNIYTSGCVCMRQRAISFIVALIHSFIHSHIIYYALIYLSKMYIAATGYIGWSEFK